MTDRPDFSPEELQALFGLRDGLLHGLMLPRIPGTVLTLTSPTPAAERLLSDVAGVYETGDGPGDRRLEIQKNGGMQRIKFGAQRTVAQKQAYTVKAAEAAGKPALVTNKQTVITIKDMQAVVLYGDTYRRVNR